LNQGDLLEEVELNRHKKIENNHPLMGNPGQPLRGKMEKIRREDEELIEIPRTTACSMGSVWLNQPSISACWSKF